MNCEDCKYYGKGWEGEGECFFNMARPCENNHTFILEWHPYPQEKPKARGRYLVSHSDGLIEILHTVRSRSNKDIIAWAEIPEPFKKEEDVQV